MTLPEFPNSVPIDQLTLFQLSKLCADTIILVVTIYGNGAVCSFWACLPFEEHKGSMSRLLMNENVPDVKLEELH